MTVVTNLQEQSILLFIPVYNCQNQILKVLTKIENNLPVSVSEIIIIDNGSVDNTQKVVIDYLKNWKNQNVTVRFWRNNKNYGLGGSHKVAYSYALDNNFAGVITLHGDNQAELTDFIEPIDSWVNKNLTVDVILGSRFSKNSKCLGYSLHRQVGNYVLNFLWSIILVRIISDIGSGLNFISTNALRQINYKNLPNSLVFNPQQLLDLIEANVRIKFVPISWEEVDQQSNAVPWKVFSISLKQVLAYRYRKLLKKKRTMLEKKEYPSEELFSTI